MEVVAGDMVKNAPPELGRLFASPEYATAMFAPPAPFVEIVTWHEAPLREHMAEAVESEVLPLPPLGEKVIVPVAPPGGYPITVAVHVVEEPTITVDGPHPTPTLL